MLHPSFFITFFHLPAVMSIEDSKMSIRYRFISLSMINSTPSTSFSALTIQKYRHPLSPLNERERGPAPSNHTRYYLIRHNRGNHQTTSVTNQRTLFWFSLYISKLSVLMNCSSPYIKTPHWREAHTHSHTYMVYIYIYIYIYTLTGDRKLSSLFTASKPNTCRDEIKALIINCKSPKNVY